MNSRKPLQYGIRELKSGDVHRILHYFLEGMGIDPGKMPTADHLRARFLDDLGRIGFEFVRRYETTPGWIAFQQEVNRRVLTREKGMAMADPPLA